MAFSASHQMKKDFRLPLVPGMTCGEELMRRQYHRSQIHGVVEDCATHIPEVPEDMTATNALMTSTIPRYSKENTGNTFAATQATANNGEALDLSHYVLRFYAYMVEPVTESAAETERVRKVVLHFYLEDGTMSVTEPQEDNSGIALGASLRRHLIRSPNGRPIAFQELRVGEPVTFYGQSYLIYDADRFTRDFFAELGQPQAAGLEVPLDTYARSRRDEAARTHGLSSMKSAHSTLNSFMTPAQVRATQHFLAHDREVLRCDCTWDDTDSLYGCKHYLTLYYFVCDGSLALVEKDTQNSGRDPFPTFFRRQRIAKPTDPSGKFDSSALGSLNFKEENQHTEYYTDADIRIGAELNLFGRKVKIHSYDAFTRSYLRDKFGITAFQPLPGAVPPPFMPPGAARRERSAEELRQSHEVKTQEVQRRRFDGSVVKFLMRLETGTFADAIRRFVLAVYPADNSLAIFEPVVRNSGIVGGKFLQRQRVNRPDGQPFSADDFFVGAHVVIHGSPFVILSSDEHSLNYMEQHGEDFSHSDINKIARKLQAMLRSKQTGLAEAFRRADEKQNHAGIEMAVFLSIMKNLKLDVSEQEIITVLRFFDKQKESYVSYEEVVSRLLPQGEVVAADDRPWQDIYHEGLSKESATFVSDPHDAELKEQQAQLAACAAEGAAKFARLLQLRRRLFMVEFRAVTDFARDSLIGTREFKMCVRQRLEISELTDAELSALCAKLFPPAFARVTYQELVRLFDGTSSLPHTLKRIIEKTSC